jgi:thioredoxin-related protein
MKKLLFAICYLFSIVSHSQIKKEGIDFQIGKSWSNILAKAKNENKYVFVDCYTTWCGPCKWIAANVFTDKEVGNFFGSNFISVSAQMDTTAKDSDATKAFYADSDSLSSKYQINAYPTFLFFNPNGELVHRFCGAPGKKEFLANVDNALHTETQYYSLKQVFNKNIKDSNYLKKMLFAAKLAYDDTKEYFKAYISTQASMFTLNNVELLKEFTKSTKDSGFNVIFNNEAAFDKIAGKGEANKLLVSLIYNFGNLKSEKIELIKKEYPTKAKEVIAKAKVLNFYYLDDWKAFVPALSDYLKSFGKNNFPNQFNEPNTLNTFAWEVFENNGDKKLLQIALRWSKKSLEGKESNNWHYIDTYANILYRLGKTKEALEMETKLLSFEDEEAKDTALKTIDKMKKGEKTWIK